MSKVSEHSLTASRALLMMSRVAFLLLMAAECVAPPPQVREVVLRVVRDVYREEGISIRHLGSISNLARPEIALLESVFQVRSMSGSVRFLRIEYVGGKAQIPRAFPKLSAHDVAVQK